MQSKSGRKPNDHDETNPSIDAFEHRVMSDQEETTLAKIKQLPEVLFSKYEKRIAKGTETYRLQQGSYGGECVFFNQDGKDCRYNLADRQTGSLYLAETPETALKEVFQHKKGVKESDLEQFYMGIVVLEKEVRVLQVKALIKGSRLTLNDVTMSTRAVTQELARKVHSAGFDGMRYPSNVTGDMCLVVWHGGFSGREVATTGKQTCLSELELDGREIADILVNELGISVEEG